MCNSVISRIKNEVNNSNSTLINETIIESDIVLLLGDFCGIEGRKNESCIDIPVYSVVSIERNGDFWNDGDSWKDVVNNKLIGKDWDENVIEYFESNMCNKKFPPPTSSGSLQLISYSGITICRNGNHRLAAAICWIASKYGDEGKLKKVNTSLVKLNREKINQIKNKVKNENFRLYLKRISQEPERINGERIVDNVILFNGVLFELKNNGELIKIKNSFKGNFFSLFSRHILRVLNNKNYNDMEDIDKRLRSDGWLEVPGRLIKLLFDNDWFIHEYNY